MHSKLRTNNTPQQQHQQYQLHQQHWLQQQQQQQQFCCFACCCCFRHIIVFFFYRTARFCFVFFFNGFVEIPGNSKQTSNSSNHTPATYPQKRRSFFFDLKNKTFISITMTIFDVCFSVSFHFVSKICEFFGAFFIAHTQLHTHTGWHTHSHRLAMCIGS